MLERTIKELKENDGKIATNWRDEVEPGLPEACRNRLESCLDKQIPSLSASLGLFRYHTA